MLLHTIRVVRGLEQKLLYKSCSAMAKMVIIIILVNIEVTFSTVTAPPPPREVYKGWGEAQAADLYGRMSAWKSKESNGGLIVNENKFWLTHKL